MRDKPVIERTLGSVSTLFAQHVAGYTGRSAEYRGADVAARAAWPVTALQDLLEEWVTALAESPARRAPRPAVPRGGAEPE
jgi:hypothetical protein